LSYTAAGVGVHFCLSCELTNILAYTALIWLDTRRVVVSHRTFANVCFRENYDL